MSATDRRQEIPDAAFAEFAAKGFRGSTLKSIAHAAGSQSSALLDWYFPTKEALFRAVLEAHPPIYGALHAANALIDPPPEIVPPLLGRGYLTILQGAAEQRFFRLLLMNALQRPASASTLIEHGPRRVLNFLTAYLTRQIAQDRPRSHNVQSSTRAFVDMLIT